MKRSGFRRRNKFGAVPTIRDGIKFPSTLEGDHYEQLKYLQIAGEISSLELQFEMVLNVNGKQICSMSLIIFITTEK